MQLSITEQKMILAALVAVTPHGGGSGTNNLCTKLMNEWKCWADDSDVKLMVAANCATVINDAIDAGVLVVDAYV